MTTSLATISLTLEKIADEIESLDVIPEEMLATFDDAKLAHAEKVGAYVHVIKRTQMEQAYYEERAEKLKRRAKTYARIETALKDRLKFQIEQTPDLPWRSVDGDRVRAQKNNPSLEVTLPVDKRTISSILLDPKGVPPEFLIWNAFYTLNLDAVKQYLVAGGKLDWASLESRGSHVRIY